MKKVWGKTKGVSGKERVGIWPSYRPLIVTLLVYIFALIVPGSVKAAVFHVAAGDVYGGTNSLVRVMRVANTTFESDNIVLAPGTYVLTRPDNDTNGPNGLPSIVHETHISCPGGIAIIQRGVNADEFRIFHISTFTDRSVPVTLSNITIRGGRLLTPSAEFGGTRGGGLFNNFGGAHSSTTLINCTVSDNTAGHQGGGIYNNGGGLILDRSTISKNFAFEGGGGIYTDEGFVNILNSTISENRNTRGGGGGFFNADGTVTLENSTVNDNSTGAGGATGGGGIRNLFGGGKITITNSTISGNKVPTGNFGSGGGIHNGDDSTVGLNHVTITNNTAVIEGGGIFNSTTGIVTVKNTIIAKNVDIGSTSFGPNNFAPDCNGTLNSQGFNLIGNTGILEGTDDSPACTLIGGTNDQVGTDKHKIDPLLGLLQDNGGYTMTHALLADSTAIDMGGRSIGRDTDQRGFLRPVDGPDDDIIEQTDIGAFEFGINRVNDALPEPKISIQPPSNDTSGCPEGFVGQFSFTASFTNTTSSELTRLVVEVEELTNGNLLSNADGGAGGAGAHLTMNREGQFLDGVLSQDESVDVRFIICLRDKKPFSFVVDVFGVEKE